MESIEGIYELKLIWSCNNKSETQETQEYKWKTTCTKKFMVSNFIKNTKKESTTSEYSSSLNCKLNVMSFTVSNDNRFKAVKNFINEAITEERKTEEIIKTEEVELTFKVGPGNALDFYCLTFSAPGIIMDNLPVPIQVPWMSEVPEFKPVKITKKIVPLYQQVKGDELTNFFGKYLKLEVVTDDDEVSFVSSYNNFGDVLFCKLVNKKDLKNKPSQFSLTLGPENYNNLRKFTHESYEDSPTNRAKFKYLEITDTCTVKFQNFCDNTFMFQYFNSALPDKTFNENRGFDYISIDAGEFQKINTYSSSCYNTGNVGPSLYQIPDEIINKSIKKYQTRVGIFELFKINDNGLNKYAFKCNDYWISVSGYKLPKTSSSSYLIDSHGLTTTNDINKALWFCINEF